MLINALLERELLYSAEGHVTGAECYIAYAEPSEEKVVLTFLSEQEVWEQIKAFCSQLNLSPPGSLQPGDLKRLKDQAEAIVQQEGGKSKSERAEQADTLSLLIKGFQQNRARIHPIENRTFSMEQLNFGNLKEAAGFARRGANSAVLRKVEYYCHHLEEKPVGQRMVIPATVREYILRRDGFRCLSCGKTASQTRLQVDHIIPVAHGGSNDISNLQALCRTCNLKKKDRRDPCFHQHFRL